MSAVAVVEKQQMELPIAALLRRRAMPGGTQAQEPAYGRVRSDSLPEHTRYRDDGCEVNPSCLTCPLPRCRYDEPGGLRGMVNSYRDGQMAEMRDNGVPTEVIADRFSVSRRTVFRILGTGVNQRREARCA